MDALRMIKHELDGRVPLIGFAGAPWTILCYMVQGKGSKTFDEAKAFCYTQPKLAHTLLQMITDATIGYLRAQAAAGADLVQIFDSWGRASGAGRLFETWSLALHPANRNRRKGCMSHRIIFAKGAWHSLAPMAATGAHGLGIDWCISPAMARELAGADVVLQGNYDPAHLLSPIPVIEREVRAMLDAFGGQRHIANLGHGILPNVPVEHARAFVSTVQSWKA